MKILFKFPSRSRPIKFFNALDNIVNNLSDKTNYQISATLDTSDHAMHNDVVKNKLATYPKVKVDWGFSRNKIDAVNRNIDIVYEWAVLILMSDDVAWLKKGFDNDIRDDFVDHGLDKVIHYYDGHAKDIISIPVMGRQYFEKYGYIYHPSYISLFCDEELYQVALKTGKLISSDRKIVEHQHHTWGFGPADSQLKSSESFHPIDKQTFLKRQRSNFFIK